MKKTLFLFAALFISTLNAASNGNSVSDDVGNGLSSVNTGISNNSNSETNTGPKNSKETDKSTKTHR